MDNTEILLTIKLHQRLFVDPKRIRLLKEIAHCGSINQAAKNAKVSYKSAWDHLEAMNAISPKPLLERNIGGKNGGGTQLTNYARRLLQLYDLLEKTQEKAFQILQDESIPLNNPLSATARFSLQSSARNQFFGKVTKLELKNGHCMVSIQIEGLNRPLVASITEKSAVRLGLVPGKEVMLMIKAPWIKTQLEEPVDKENQFLAEVRSVSDKGSEKEIILSIGENPEFCATIEKTVDVAVNQKRWLYIDPEQIVLASL
ncbi:TOBE domain-containing protein [Basfia succiniciproducens]|uniref:Molybdate transport system regulatory protein n=1 Tax=Basfia succiniciproducens TaxID=653940 RepID=A0A1G5AJD0_9PAST|nr:TOBE domain-containing protein [Basfia succiniciproducens]QIM68666.1 molybdenum-dependent transcriptional regulator [Basfia succiniciproducens]SCX77996.1 molybdate transport system regulatory protein [Basfia succiniciproducens]